MIYLKFILLDEMKLKAAFPSPPNIYQIVPLFTTHFAISYTDFPYVFGTNSRVNAAPLFLLFLYQ